jgi:hypothetical protein
MTLCHGQALFSKTAPDFSSGAVFFNAVRFYLSIYFPFITSIKYWPYWFFFSGSMSVRSWSLPIQPFR